MKNIGLFNNIKDINFLKYKNIYFIFSACAIILSVIFIIFKGFNLGVDFKGGIVVDIRPISQENSNEQKPYNVEEVKQKISSLNISDFSIKEFGNNDLQIIISNSAISKNNTAVDIIENLKNTLSDFIYLQTQYVGPSISKELIKSSTLALGFAFLGIMFYSWVRFDWQYGIIAVLAIIHDVLFTFFSLSLFSFELNISSIAAILTVAGYSINDTVVLFDQVRENVRKYIKQDNVIILNKSINQILSRSLSTSLTVVFVLASIFLLGGEALKSFSFALLIGVVIGTYSSICLAVPLLLYIGNIKARVLSKEKNNSYE